MEHDYRNQESTEQLALGLGWFSIGLGLAELFAPRSVAQLIGIPNANAAVLRAFGLREIGAGLAILNEPDRPAWLWSRVGGDALDLSYLASGLNDSNNSTRIAATMAAVLGVTALDAIVAQRLESQRSDERRPLAPKSRSVRIEHVTTINKPVHEVYQFWRRFENLPKFMRHLESVEVLDERRSRWRAKASAGMKVEWEAELLEDRPDEWIAWRSIPGSQIDNSGSIRFSPAPGARGTEVRVQLQYNPPAGALGRRIAWLFGAEPDQQVNEDLRRLKQLMETGEIPISDGPSLRRAARPGDPEKIRALAGVRS